MKILQINQCHYRRGGADVVYLNSIKLLKSRGHEVACFSTQNVLNEDSEFSSYFVPTVDLRKASLIGKLGNIKPYLFNKEANNSITKLIEDFKPDIAHVHLYYGTLSVSVLLALHRMRIPVLHTVHDYRLLCPVNSFMDINGDVCEACAKGNSLNCFSKKCSEGKVSQSTIVMLEGLYWKYLNSPLSYIDNFHFVSNFCKEKHIQYLPQIKTKSTVFYNFSSLTPKENSTNNKRYYLYYGRLSSEKGISTLIEAWSKLPNHINLKIAGNGALFSYVQQKIKELNINNIQLLGHKNGTELNQLIENAYFVIVPSEWFENNPMAIVESYSLRKPVIGSNIGGIPEIIIENKTGFIFEPKNILQLRETILKADNLSVEQYNDFSKSAFNFALEHFSQDTYYDSLIQVYKDTIENCQNRVV